MASNYLQFHQSLTNEFFAIKDRVRYLIGDRHWGEEGRFKEIILRNHLRRFLPTNVGIGTGFIKGRNKLSRQIDIIVYEIQSPVFFREGDFVILPPESVLGLIEVKTKLRSTNVKDAIRHACIDKALIANRRIFNGLFSYETDLELTGSSLPTSIKTPLQESSGVLNHIALGPDLFIKYWDHGNPADRDKRPCYSFYELKGLTFGYFLSNLLELIHKQTSSEDISKTFAQFLYPIRAGKETKRLQHLDLKLN